MICINDDNIYNNDNCITIMMIIYWQWAQRLWNPWAPRRPSSTLLGIHYRGVQWEGGAVDRGGII